MSTEKIILPDFVMADLYRSNLVVIDHLPDTTKLTKKTKADKDQKLAFLGNNGKNILILVSDESAVYLNDDALQFLSSILTACKLNLGDVAIVNIEHTSADYTILKKEFAPKYLLIFNILPQKIALPFAFPQYQLQDYDQCKLLLAPALETMLGNSQEAKLEKSKLWLSLKKMFNI